MEKDGNTTGQAEGYVLSITPSELGVMSAAVYVIAIIFWAASK